MFKGPRRHYNRRHARLRTPASQSEPNTASARAHQLQFRTIHMPLEHRERHDRLVTTQLLLVRHPHAAHVRRALLQRLSARASVRGRFGPTGAHHLAVGVATLRQRLLPLVLLSHDWHGLGKSERKRGADRWRRRENGVQTEWNARRGLDSRPCEHATCRVQLRLQPCVRCSRAQENRRFVNSPLILFI